MGVNIVLLLVLAGAALFAQNPVLLRDTYRLGSDQPDAPLVQTDPRLYHNDSTNFLVAWEDQRFGRQDFYFRRISSEGAFLSEPKPISGNNNILFLPDGQFVAFSGRWSPYMFDDSYYSVGAQRYQNGEPVGDEVVVSGYPSLWCGTGWMGFSYSAVAAYGGFVTHTAVNGSIYRKRFNANAEPVYETQESDISDAVYVTSAVGTGGAPAIFWVDQPWDYFGTGQQHRIYARFYDSMDSVAVDSVRLFTFSGWMNEFFSSAETSIPLFVKPVENNSYRLIYYYQGKIYTLAVRQDGVITSAPDSISVPDITATGEEFRKISISNTHEGAFELIVTTYEFSTGQNGYHIYKFFTDNTPAQLTSVYSTVRYDLSRNTASYENGKMFVPSTENNDVYIKELQNFVQTGSAKLCDDPPQSNETNRFLIQSRQGGGFIAGYQNEKGYYATKMNITASSADTTPHQIMSNTFGTFRDGTMFCVRPVPFGGERITVVDLYDADFTFTRTDTIRGLDGSVFYSEYLVTFTESSSGGLVYSVNQSGTLLAGRMNREFVMQSYSTIASPVSQWSLISIDEEHSNSWLIRWGDTGVFTDSNFTITEGPFQHASGVYMGQDVVVVLYQASGSPVNVSKMRVKALRTGTLVDENIGYPVQSFQVVKGDGSYYLLYYRDTGGKIVCRAYKMNGTPLRNPVVLASNVDDLQGFTLAVSGTSLGLIWADHSGVTYDIYGRIFSLTSITNADETSAGAPSEYILQQNFPNPFNPETKISYTLPLAGVVELRIYDALGRLAGVIESGEKQAGSYTVNFDGSKLASGIYFCEMRAGSYRGVIKMILMK